MLLSGLIGFLFGRYLSDKKYYLFIPLVLGVVLGFFGHLGLVYPFYIDVQRNIIVIPEFTYYGFFFLHPSLKLLDIPTLLNTPLTIPPIVHVVFVTASVGGVLIGYTIGCKLKPPIRLIE